MASLLIVEDNTTLAYGLRNNLEIEGHEVTVAETGTAGVEAAKRLNPDLVILDLMLPEMDGYRVLRSLREAGMEMPVLILTAKGEEADKVLGFRLGADDYVTKPFGVLEMLARVEALLRRCQPNGAGTTGEVVSFGDVEVDPRRRTVSKAGQTVGLSPKEFDLLVSLLGRNGEVASRAALLKEVWGHRAEVASRTVDTHVAELRKKLEDEPGSPRFILTAHKVGYRLRRSS